MTHRRGGFLAGSSGTQQLPDRWVWWRPRCIARSADTGRTSGANGRQNLEGQEAPHEVTGAAQINR